MSQKTKQSLTEIISQIGNDLKEDMKDIFTGAIFSPILFHGTSLIKKVGKYTNETVGNPTAYFIGWTLGTVPCVAEFCYIQHQIADHHNYVPLIAVGAVQAGAIIYNLYLNAKKSIEESKG